MSRFVLTLLRYVWALPNTALGLTFAPLAWLGRGGVRFVDGVIEIEGGGVRWLLRNATPIGGAMALTLGHVVLGQSRAALDVSREHERVHVRQYERWGPFFLPAYFAGSAIAAIRGGHFYRDNPFEREAYGIVQSGPDR